MSPLAIFTGPYALAAKWGVIALLVAAFGAWSYTRGIARESDRRDAQELEQVKIEHEGHAKAVAYGVEQAKKAQAAEASADNYRQKWKGARDAAKIAGTPLAVADCGAASIVQTSAGSGLSSPAPGVRLRLTWEFVGLWDGAYTAGDGQSLFGDTARVEKGSAGPSAASPYGPDELLDRHETNAARWDACRRQVRAMNATIDGLERAWNARHGR